MQVEKEDLTILYEDNHLIVVVKPQNVPTQADSSGDADLLSAVKAYVKEKYGKPGEAFIGLVHRLDRPTGGVMVFARTSKAAARLGEQIKNGAFVKKYLAVTVGTPRDRAGRLTNWLVKDEATNTVRIVPAKVNEAARMAVLDYKVLEERPPGVPYRRASHHRPVAPGARTAGRLKDPDIRRRAVRRGHRQRPQPGAVAYELRFTHPTTGNAMVFKVFPPADKEPWKRFPIDRYINVSRPESRY